MPATATNVAASFSNIASTTSLGLGSLALAGGGRYLLSIAYQNTALAVAPTVTIAQPGATWTEVAADTFSNGERRALRVFQATPADNVAAAAITATFTGATAGGGTAWVVDRLHSTGTALQTVNATASSTTAAAALGAGAATDLTYFIAACQATSTWTPGAGITELGDVGNGAVGLFTGYGSPYTTSPSATRVLGAQIWTAFALRFPEGVETPPPEPTGPQVLVRNGADTGWTPGQLIVRNIAGTGWITDAQIVPGS